MKKLVFLLLFCSCKVQEKTTVIIWTKDSIDTNIIEEYLYNEWE